MSCRHIWCYKKFEDLTLTDYVNIKSKADTKAYSNFKPSMPFEEFAFKCAKYYKMTDIDALAKRWQQRMKMAKLYMENVDSDYTLLSNYIPNIQYEDDIYFNVPFNDKFIVCTMPTEKDFKSANEMIDFFDNIGWNYLYWTIHKRDIYGHTALEKAHERIRKLYEDNPNAIFNFG